MLKLTIEADGRVSACRSRLVGARRQGARAELVQRVLLFQFEKRDVERITTTKPTDFFGLRPPTSPRIFSASSHAVTSHAVHGLAKPSGEPR